jgi:hypothetical protein
MVYFVQLMALSKEGVVQMKKNIWKNSAKRFLRIRLFKINCYGKFLTKLLYLLCETGKCENFNIYLQ